jgi:hypothetical protein
MIRTVLREADSKEPLHTDRDPSGNPTLVTTNYGKQYGTFSASTISGANTTTIVEAKGNQGIVLTDIIAAFEKNAATGNVTLQFSDGVNTVIIAGFELSAQPQSLVMPFQGHWAGWQACDIQVVSDAAGNTGTVSVGYYRTPTNSTLAYDEWDARR